MNKDKTSLLKKTDEQWAEELDSESYHILREKGTETPFTGVYNLCFEKGSYLCKGCKSKLFESGAKFDSGCGWPSFDNSLKGAVNYKEDKSLGRVRTEITCATCGGHLGHVFDDGPTTTGRRYCVNSLSIDFEK